MYGYVRPAMDRLSGEERELFQAAGLREIRLRMGERRR